MHSTRTGGCAASRHAGPLSLPPGERHWYMLGEFGFPPPDTFLPSFRAASRVPRRPSRGDGSPAGANRARRLLPGLDDELCARTGSGTAPTAGLIALSGFLPTVDSFEYDLAPPFPRIAIGHGTLDPVIGVEWGRQAKQLLEEAGADVLYREYPLPHTVDPSFLAELRPWLEQAIPPAG